MTMKKGDIVAIVGSVDAVHGDKIEITLVGTEILQDGEKHRILAKEMTVRLLESKAEEGDEVVLRDKREGKLLQFLNDNIAVILLDDHDPKSPQSYINVSRNDIKRKNQDGAMRFIRTKIDDANKAENVEREEGRDIYEKSFALYSSESDKQPEATLTDEWNREETTAVVQDTQEEEPEESERESRIQPFRMVRLSSTDHDDITPVIQDEKRSAASDEITVEMPEFPVRPRRETVTAEQENHETSEHQEKHDLEGIKPSEDVIESRILPNVIVKAPEEKHDVPVKSENSAEQAEEMTFEPVKEGKTLAERMEEIQRLSEKHAEPSEPEVIEEEHSQIDPERAAKIASLRQGTLENLKEKAEETESGQSEEDRDSEKKHVFDLIKGLDG